MPDRRRRIIVLGGALAALPALAQGKPPRIGVLLAASLDGPDAPGFLHELREGLRALGREEGRGYVLEVRGTVAQLVAAHCDVLVSETSSAAQALRQQAAGKPIVVAAAAERPQDGLTGLMAFDPRQNAALVDLARELVPRAHIGLLYDPARPAAAPPELERLELAGAADVPRFAERLAASPADVLVVAAQPGLVALREPIVRECLAAGVPVLGPDASFAELGALASYGCDVAANFRAAAGYVDRILKGAQPGELAVEPPRRFELVLNVKAARALHLELPRDALLRADRVIE
jgi:putative ABC transport system substrate-binding protein